MTDTRASRRQRNAPTITDVARQAGVSPMTVSRVINGEQVVRPETRAKVEAAIAALNYAPSAAARTLAGGDETRIGLLYSNPSSSYLSEFLVGSLDQASRSGVDLVVEKWDEETSIASVVAHLERGRINGVILPPPLCDHADMVQALDHAGIPAVAVATGRAPSQLAAVSIDDREAAYEMTRHLIALGHARIGFIKGNPNQTASAAKVRKSYHSRKVPKQAATATRWWLLCGLVCEQLIPGFRGVRCASWLKKEKVRNPQGLGGSRCPFDHAKKSRGAR